jgi:hypothetical protein
LSAGGRRPQSASFDALAPLVRELVAGGGRVRLKVTGASMRPFIRSGAVVELAAIPAGGCAPGTVVLVELAGGRHVLHRVTRRVAGGVLTRGDANLDGEGPHPAERLVARVVGLVRGGRVVPLDAGALFRLGRLWGATRAGAWLLGGWCRARRAGGALRQARRAAAGPGS